MIFNAFERMVAMRYLRARRQEGFISVIAGFSLLGIALGVGTLIVVMSVMNGFHVELLNKILGFNAHLDLSSNTGSISGFDDITEKLKQVPGIASVTPTVQGRSSSPAPAAPAAVPWSRVCGRAISSRAP
jgi:lipoprotein-releasing system permease protein